MILKLFKKSKLRIKEADFFMSMLPTLPWRKLRFINNMYNLHTKVRTSARDVYRCWHASSIPLNNEKMTSRFS